MYHFHTFYHSTNHHCRLHRINPLIFPYHLSNYFSIVHNIFNLLHISFLYILILQIHPSYQFSITLDIMLNQKNKFLLLISYRTPILHYKSNLHAIDVSNNLFHVSYYPSIHLSIRVNLHNFILRNRFSCRYSIIHYMKTNQDIFKILSLLA